MSARPDLNDTTVKTTSKVVWFAIQSSAPLFIIAILLFEYIAELQPVLVELRNVFIGLCVVSLPTPFIILNLFKQKQREVSNNIQLGMDNDAKLLQSYMSLLIIGLSLCNLSAVLGLILYITTGEIELSIFFIIVSLLLGFLYKPSLS